MSIPFNPTRSIVTLLAITLLTLTGCVSDETAAPLGVDPLDEVPPLAPTGASVGKTFYTKFVLSWDDNTEVDLAGYRVYRYAPDPGRQNAYVEVSGGLVLDSSMTLAGDPGANYIFRITAVDTSDNESAWSDAFIFAFVPDSDTEDAVAGGNDSEIPDYDLPEATGRDPNEPTDDGSIDTVK